MRDGSNDPSDQAAGREQRFRWEYPLSHPAVSNYSGLWASPERWELLGGCLHHPPP